jgi:hypothetical protein
MIPFKSSVSKIIIYASPDIDDHDLVQEVVIFAMQGVKVLRAKIIGSLIDSSDADKIIEDIMNEETDSRFMSSEFTNVEVKKIDGDNDLFIQEIFETLVKFTVYLNTIDAEYEYIIYNSNSNLDPGFFEDLFDYVSDKNDDLIPTHFTDVFSEEPDLDDLLTKYQITDHMHSKESSISCAVYTGIFLDISLGK